MTITRQKTIFNKNDNSLLEYFKIYTGIFKVKTHLLGTMGMSENKVFKLTGSGWVEQSTSVELMIGFDNQKAASKMRELNSRLQKEELGHPEYKDKREKIINEEKLVKRGKKYNKKLLKETAKILDY